MARNTCTLCDHRESEWILDIREQRLLSEFDVRLEESSIKNLARRFKGSISLKKREAKKKEEEKENKQEESSPATAKEEESSPATA